MMAYSVAQVNNSRDGLPFEQEFFKAERLCSDWH